MVGYPRFALALAAALIPVARGQQCSGQAPAVDNGDFETDAGTTIGALNTYRYAETPTYVPGWVAAGRAIWLGTSAGAWRIQASNVDAEGNRRQESYALALQKSLSSDCPRCISTDPGSIEQTVAGLVPGDPYRISVMASRRPGYHPEHQVFSVSVGGSVIAANVLPESYFTEHSWDFTATADSTVIRLENTSPLEGDTGFRVDHTVFLDDVTLCHLGTTTTTVTTSTTSTTATATTHTVLEDTRREVIELQSMMIASQSAQSRMQSQMESMASRLATAETASTAVAAVDTRVTDLTNVIRRAVASLPVGVGGGGGGSSSRSPPTIVADDNDLTVQARGGDVIIETGTCGSLNPCDILGALTSLREV